MTTNNIFIIDSRVADYQSLMAALPVDSKAFLLNPDQDGIEQMQAILSNYSDLDSIQIISHGAQGALYLGNTVLSQDNIDHYRNQLGDIGNSLTPSGDLLLYGCDVAQGDTGRQFIDRLALLTAADVAASDDLTGSAALGGDWKLEATTGTTETVPQSLVGYEGLLILVYSGPSPQRNLGEFSNNYAFAALKADGSVVTWGDSTSGGDSSSVASKLDGTVDVTQIFSANRAFAALRADGSVVTWGNSSYGGDSTNVASKLDGTVDVTKIFSANNAFAALRADGSVVTWGDSFYGTDVASKLDGTVDVTQIFSTGFAFAALRADGSVVTWGNSSYGGDSSSVAGALINVTKIFSTDSAFAALRADGSVVTWGDSSYGGDSTNVASKLDGTVDVTQVFSTDLAFAALRADGSVVTWGNSSYGGDSTNVASKLDGIVDVTKIFSTGIAFAALRADGSVVTWGNSTNGGDSSSVANKLDGTVDVTQIFSTGIAFAALRADGSVVTWGGEGDDSDGHFIVNQGGGGISSSVASALNGTVDVTRIFSTNNAFAALRADGSVVTWGLSYHGGDSSSVASQLSSGVVGLADIYTDDFYTVDPMWQITPNAPIVSETSGTIEFTITRPDDRLGNAETVYVSTHRLPGGSINEGDYVGLLNQPYTFAADKTSRTVVVDILPDSIAEPDETFGLIVQTNPTDLISNSLASTTFTISENVIPPINLAPTAQPVSPTKNLQPSQSVALNELFTWNDPNGISDVVSFAVRDRDVGGGYLTENGIRLQDDQLFDNVPIAEIANWAFVAGEAGSVDDVAFNAIDAAGAFNTPSAVSTVNATTTNTLASASSLELEFFARQVAYGYEPGLSSAGEILPSGHFAEGWKLEKEFFADGGLFRAVILTKEGFEPVLAIRGTGTGPDGTLSENIADWIANTHVLLGVGGEEFKAAWDLPDGIKQWLIDHPNASITGHSQGGAQAQMLAYEAAKSSIKLGQLVTFNSPGINTTATDLTGTLDSSNVTHFISAGDIVSQVGEQFVPGKVVYYDWNLQPSLLGVLKLVNDAHTDHWAQQALYDYDANFLRKDDQGRDVEDVYAPRTIKTSIKELTTGKTEGNLSDPEFSHLALVGDDNNIDDDYSNFATQVENYIAAFPPLSLLLGFGPTRAAEILSSRAGSESGRTNELPSLLNLVSNISSIIKQADGLIYTGGDAEKIEFALTILTIAIELGFRDDDEPFEFIATILKSVGSTSVDLALDYARWYGNAIVGIGSTIQDATAVGFQKFLSTSLDVAEAIKDRFIPDTPIVVVQGNNANSTPAVIVDGQMGDSAMTSASGNSIFIVDDGKETISSNGGNNLIMGTPSAMDGTKVNNFKPSDVLFFFGANLQQNDLSAVKGSAILTLDTDGDGQGDTVVTLAGDFRLESFVVEASSSGSYIRYLGNAVPVAENDDRNVSPEGFVTDEDSAFTTANVLANDSDEDGDVLHISGIDTTSTLGLVIDNGNGTFNYNPNGAFDYLNAGESATDSFVYTVSDGNGGNDTATVAITINGVNNAPIANDDKGAVNEDSSVTFSFAQLFANDINVDGVNQTITAIDTTGTAGSVVIDTVNRTITYSADADALDLLVTGAAAQDSFKYTLQGSSGETSTATVAINVVGVNDGVTLSGTVRRDILNGTSGEDLIKGNNGNDDIYGGEGADNLFGENGNDRLEGGNSIDKLFGGNGNDWLRGGNGNDSLFGGNDSDWLEGGTGNDWLDGEKGVDILTGDSGSDVFAFAKAGGKDIITDFTDGVDKIQIAANTGITNFSQLKITGKTVSGVAIYTTIDLGHGDKITLTGVSSTALDATDFIFSA